MRTKPKLVIGLFFAGLSAMAILELLLIQGLHRLAGWTRLFMSPFDSILGFLLVAAGLALVIGSVWVQYTLGEGAPAPMAATKKLVTRGPYAYTRNPMTLGAAMLYLGIAVWQSSILMAALVLIVFASLLTYIYFHETSELANRFGAEYRAYRQKTPFLFPRFRKGG